MHNDKYTYVLTQNDVSVWVRVDGEREGGDARLAAHRLVRASRLRLNIFDSCAPLYLDAQRKTAQISFQVTSGRSGKIRTSTYPAHCSALLQLP